MQEGGTVPSSTAPLRVFINYRRGDSSGYAGRLYDALSGRAPDWQVFMDIDTIEPGTDFVEVIETALDSCDVVIAVIGRGWTTAANAKGQRRLDDPHDFVRLELTKALERHIRIIPALVQGTEMPATDEFPEELAPLARRHALELSDARWRYDVDRLVHLLERVREEAAAAAEQGRREQERREQEHADADRRREQERREREQAEAQKKREQERIEIPAAASVKAETDEITATRRQLPTANNKRYFAAAAAVIVLAGAGFGASKVLGSSKAAAPPKTTSTPPTTSTINAHKPTSKPEPVEVPKVIGRTESGAVRVLGKRLRHRVTFEYTLGKAGIVVRQVPRAGSHRKKGSLVWLIVSKKRSVATTPRQTTTQRSTTTLPPPPSPTTTVSSG